MNNQQNEIEKTEAQRLNEVLSSIKNVITQNLVTKIDDIESEVTTNTEDNDHVLVLTEVASITHNSSDTTQFSDNTLNKSGNTKYNDTNGYIEQKERNDMPNSYKRDANSNNENYNTTILPIGNKKLIPKHSDNLVSETTAIKVESTVQKLKDIIKDDVPEENKNTHSSDNKGQTIEEIVTGLLEQRLTKWLDVNLSSAVTDLLNPKLSQWLNENLHIMVDKIVREEIQKLLQTSDKHKGTS